MRIDFWVGVKLPYHNIEMGMFPCSKVPLWYARACLVREEWRNWMEFGVILVGAHHKILQFLCLVRRNRIQLEILEFPNRHHDGRCRLLFRFSQFRSSGRKLAGIRRKRIWLVIPSPATASRLLLFYDGFLCFFSSSEIGHSDSS